MGLTGSKPNLWTNEVFFRFGSFRENEEDIQVYIHRKAKMFKFGQVIQDTQPITQINRMEIEQLQEHELISSYLKDYFVQVGERRIVNAHYRFRTDRAYGIFAVVYFVPSQKIYRTGWCYGIQILLPLHGAPTLSPEQVCLEEETLDHQQTEPSKT
jgi:hypothetical protein